MSNENNNISTWDFVEKYYPNYHSSDKIAAFFDYEKIVKSFHPLEQIDCEGTLAENRLEIYEEAIQAFLMAEKEKNETNLPPEENNKIN